MRKFLFLLVLLAAYPINAQIKFELGYILDKHGGRKEVLIQNKDWRVNPLNIEYKHAESGSTLTAGINDITAFGIGDEAKYERFLAPIDKSPVRLDALSTNPEPEYQNELVFLNKLVEGKASLYLYQSGGTSNFFFTLNNGELQPLVQKSYYTNGKKLSHNNSFRNQLYSELNCGKRPVGDFRNIKYTAAVLVKFFEDYNKCALSDYKVFEKSGRKMIVSLNAKAGLDFSKLAVIHGYDADGKEFQPPVSIRAGGELELVLPFNRNKWAVLFEATYRSLSVGEEYLNAQRMTTNFTLDLKYITASGGLRHYFFLTDEFKLFLNAAVAFDLPVKTDIKFDRDERYPMDPVLNEVEITAYPALSVGVYLNNKFNAELRYEMERQMGGRNFVPTHYDLKWKSSTTTFSVFVGYKIF